ncbi:MarR family transcriptional regulator [Actinoplanes sp. TBRC 11911]|uniref:MarR family winged helix-turn-helix transcriptional regulator n=1 Tax=Actinoplanes sp. TBRC 11911 TaxID=2729386 RepID=UPI00145C6A35|nr:MarR family transcriptional regulator [Actinoplanes sp. TBRC 11911]NMO53338.1 MarR family transcriptional regulator [Actinoplanes sp. TBRC 11911]
MTQNRSLLTSEERAVLGRFVQVAQAVQRMVDHDLSQESDLSLSEYVALWRLSQAVDGRLRLAELASSLRVTPGRISRVVAKLEKRGFVVREPDDDDHRGWNAVLLGVGRTCLTQSEHAYVASARRNFFDHLNDQQLRFLSSLLASITAN